MIRFISLRPPVACEAKHLSRALAKLSRPEAAKHFAPEEGLSLGGCLFFREVKQQVSSMTATHGRSFRVQRAGLGYHAR